MKIAFEDEAGEVEVRVIGEFCERGYVVTIKPENRDEFDGQLCATTADPDGFAVLLYRDFDAERGEPHGDRRGIRFEDIEHLTVY